MAFSESQLCAFKIHLCASGREELDDEKVANVHFQIGPNVRSERSRIMSITRMPARGRTLAEDVVGAASVHGTTCRLQA
ncbi:unnamed protein product [Danaus chrysippus]|uniref:(African queen) hypothetical protein n=1 Tax=Danaus chrysippus TaxID=151541 RepID=A0A8J2R4P6_9NEOP|nr:unnamed protein product [Danaus chrysippus]